MPLHKTVLSALDEEASGDGCHHWHLVSVAEAARLIEEHDGVGYAVFAACPGIVGHQNAVTKLNDGTYRVLVDDTVHHDQVVVMELEDAVARLAAKFAQESSDIAVRNRRAAEERET